ncbi:flippase-like domain-containing protein [candidate division FCPU426 bacterium]|nr:flippase-like domain-containing protein [candidate division FCPU426 bacterium]
MSIFAKKRFWFGFFITGFCLFLVFRQVDVQSLTRALLHADYEWLLPALAVYLLGYMIRVVRWQYLLRNIKDIPWPRLLPPLILSFMVNNLFPARAGEFVGAYIVGRRENMSKSSVFATVVMQRAYDGLVMVLFASIVLFFFNLPHTGNNAKFVNMVNTVLNITTAVFVLLFAVLFAMITWKELAVKSVRFITAVLPEKWRHGVDRIFQSFLNGLGVLRNRRDSLIAFILTVLAWSGETAAYYFIMRAFGLAFPVYVSIMLMAVVNLGIMIPSSPGYVGPFEFFGVGTLLLFGVSKSVALPCVLVIHTLIWLPITVWGFYYMWTLKLSFKEMETAEQQTQSSASA